MKNLLSRAGALALALILPCAALAQAPVGKSIQAPFGYLQASAIYCDDGTGHAALCNFGSGGSGGSGTATITSRISYTATASGTGYSAGDQLDRVVTFSPATNQVSGYWINVSAGGLLTGAPAAVNITIKPETLTNTGFTALQGGAANTASNPFFFQATAGNAVIGKVGFDQSAPGTSNGVTINDRTGAALGTPTNPFGFNLAQIGGNTVATGTGTANAGTPRVVLSSDSPAPLVFGSQTDPACTTSDATACSAIALWKEMVGQYTQILQAYKAAGTTATTGLGVQGMTGGVPLVVSGQVADGSAPGVYSLPAAGIDAGGLKRTLRTDPNGNLQVGGTVAQADGYQAGTIASGTASAAYMMPIANGYGTGGVVITGLTASGAVLTPEGSFDGTNFVPVQVVQAGTKVMVSAIAADGQFRFNASGRRAFRFRVTTTGTGTINASSTLSVAGFDAPAPALDTLGNATVNLATGSTIDTVVKSTPTDRGAIIGTTAVTLMAANSARRGFSVQVQSSTASCYISGQATATSDYHALMVAAGQLYETPPNHVSTGAISIICTGASTSVYAREY